MAEIVRWQARFSRRTSPLYGELLERAATDVEAGGPASQVLSERAGDREASALALRFMAAVHRLVLDGRAPELAAFYPTAGGTSPPEESWPAFVDTLKEHLDELRELVAHPCQTNEVGRSAALLPGFLAVARSSSLPMRLLELGASAGLNLRWDRYRFDGSGVAWGDPNSPVRMVGMFAEPPPPLDGGVSIRERRGCDPHPLDPADPADRLTLMSSVWGDQPERLHLLRAAFEVAEHVPARVDRANAAPWLEERLSEPAEGVTTVVYHSVVLQYLDDEERRRVFGAIGSAGERATSNGPFAWLRFESGDWRRTASHEVWLTTWPGGAERKLAEAGPHGRPVRWLAGSA